MTVTIQTIAEQLMRPVEGLSRTVDGLLFGEPDTEVTGIMTAFMPTLDVIEQAIARGANLIIAHEGPFFSHSEQTGAREDDPVYQAKKNRIRESGIAIFRLHDAIHRYRPDWIMRGLIDALGWEAYVREHRPEAAIVRLPGTALRNIAAHVKERLGIPYVRVLGDLDQTCARVGLLAGYRGGGDNVIPLAQKEALDLVMYGEGPEWESPEYVRDAIRAGMNMGLIVLGHAESEIPGMKLLAIHLRTLHPAIPVHVASEQPLFEVW